ncbi:MAG: hypothetical protein BroJett002_37230 [Candidatus Brocadia sinica]|nr:MAG: hypothetical protein BroJett002_37230 [Candidatus Brocadia sinica]
MKKINENGVKKAIKEWLEWHGYKVFRINNGGVYSAKREKYIFHGKAGFSDMVAIKEPYILFIETKATGKKCSEEQEEFLRSVNNCGTPAGFMADSFEAFEKQMKELKLWIY